MNPLTIAETTIRQDAQGRYCLNDLHMAAGGIPHHRPSKWLANKQAQALISEMASKPEFGLAQSPNSGSGPTELEARIRASLPGDYQARIPAWVEPVKTDKPKTGLPATFVVKELVYAYAMWISPAFHLKVIRAYDALVTGEYIQPNIQHENYWFARRPLWPTIRARVLAGECYRDIAGAIGRSIGSVARAVRRMIEVGLLNPLKVAEYQRGPARVAAQRRVFGWGSPQLSLFP